MLFQISITFFQPWNIKKDALKNVHAALFHIMHFKWSHSDLGLISSKKADLSCTNGFNEAVQSLEKRTA